MKQEYAAAGNFGNADITRLHNFQNRTGKGGSFRFPMETERFIYYLLLIVQVKQNELNKLSKNLEKPDVNPENEAVTQEISLKIIEPP